ncbi:uncharacterized protein LOC143626913 [Bidens hawaiensis]|uniref:uncharacterized protein LOC143626913 n=1 Tax=Bidens hawaiensis TaxID=980011 RepID=UPI00404B581F
MVKAIRLHEHGAPEMMKLDDVELGEPKTGEIKMKNIAIGINYLDVYMRKGLLIGYSPPLPYTPGMEAAGIVIAIGPEVTSCKVGDIVAYAGFPVCAYTEEQILPAERVVQVPPFIDPIIAAAAIFKGLTAQVLVRSCFKVGPGHTILYHAAAGGVGSLACQWANALGATVIGTVSTKEKAVQAKEDGCHHVIIYNEENFVDRVMEITSGKGVDVAYDSIGKATFEGSLACVKTCGYMVSFGMASGEPELTYRHLTYKSVFFTIPQFLLYTEARSDLLAASDEVFSNIEKGTLRVRVNQYPLSQAVQAHSDLESRKTTGSIVLIPNK